MDMQEEQNSKQPGDEQVPAESAPGDSPEIQAEAHESPADDSAVAEQSPVASDDDTPKSPSPNHDNKPGSLPDDADSLKSLVEERDGVIADLRHRNQDLQKKLNEKEKVVTALTSRLEQAAEQLDRLRRSGADRGGKILSGIPVEVIEEQRELINDLKSAIQHWEDLQSTSAMGRFEAQIVELREMLAEQLDLKDRIDSGGTAKGFKSTPAPAGHQRGSWDEMKAQLLGDSSATTPKVNSNSDVMIPGAEPVESGTEKADGKSKFEEEFESEFAIDIPERPAAVENLDEADAETLKSAVQERDKHIDRLMEVIDALKELSGQGELEEARQRQKALQGRLEKAESEMKEKLRQAEIEMSMERAKLAREAARLQQLSSGGGAASALEENGAKKEEAKSGSEDKGSRWSRFLGSK